MKEILIGVLSAGGGALIISIGALVRRAIWRRVRVSSPEAEQLKQVVPAVNALLEIQGPQTEALIALLEAQQGKCNGNVEKALHVASAARDRFDGFLRKAAQVSEVVA